MGAAGPDRERVAETLEMLARSASREESLAVALGHGLAGLGARDGAVGEGDGAGGVRVSTREGGAPRAVLVRALEACAGSGAAACSSGGDGLLLIASPLRGTGGAGAIVAEVADGGPEAVKLLAALSAHLGAALERGRALEETRRILPTWEAFLSTVAHEIRGPLATIAMWAHVLGVDGRDDATRARAVQAIETSLRAQSRLIEDLLDLSRAAAGKLQVDLTPVPIAPIARDAVATSRPGAESRGVRVALLVEDEHAAVRADGRRLTQVISGVLARAVDVTPEGGCIEVTVGRGGGGVRVLVRDGGESLDAVGLARVVEPLSSEGGVTKMARGGLVLGLAIARRLVDLHGGSLRAERPAAGPGTVVVIELPETRSEGSDLTSSAGPPALLRGARLLVVDDEQAIRDALVRVLGMYGATVRAASSGAEALASLGAWMPDAIVSDIGMPDQDGYAFMRELRARSAEEGGEVPSLALTAHAGRDARARAIAAGFQRHLEKPIDAAHLAIAIDELLRPNGVRSPP